MIALASLVRRQRALLLGWAIGLFAYLLLIGLAFSAVKDNAQFDELWAEYPEALREALGGVSSLTSVQGFLEAEATALLPLLLGLLTVMASTRPLAGAEETGALDHLLARPVSRRAYLVGVGVQQGILIATALGAAAVGGVLGFALVGVRGRELVGVVGAILDLAPVSFLFMGLALFLGAAFHRRGPAVGVGVAVILTLFVLEIVRNLVKDLDWLKWLNPLAYASESNLFDGRPSLAYYVLMLFGGLALAVAALIRFERKDLFA